MFLLDPPLETTRTTADSSSRHHFSFFTLIRVNGFLFWAVVVGALSVFPVVYIPGLNTEVFKHKAITWKWALAAGAVVMFVVGVEMWKLVKRRCGLFAGEDGGEEEGSGLGLGLRQGFFSMARSLTGSRVSWAGTEEKGREGRSEC